MPDSVCGNRTKLRLDRRGFQSSYQLPQSVCRDDIQQCMTDHRPDEGARVQDQRLRQQLPAMARALGFPLNFSTGLATLQPGETLERLMIRADMALYAAKGAGRGQLQIAAAQRDGEQP